MDANADPALGPLRDCLLTLLDSAGAPSTDYERIAFLQRALPLFYEAVPAIRRQTKFLKIVLKVLDTYLHFANELLYMMSHDSFMEILELRRQLLL